jgi:hypothetical protein
MKGYFGHIEDIDLSIRRGAYIIKDIYLNKIDTVKKHTHKKLCWKYYSIINRSN